MTGSAWQEMPKGFIGVVNSGHGRGEWTIEVGVNTGHGIYITLISAAQES